MAKVLIGASASTCLFHEYSGLIAFRIDWFDIPAVQGTHSLHTTGTHWFSSAQSSLWSNFHIRTWLLEKPWPWLGGPLAAKWCVCFSILPRFAIGFLPRNKHLLILWLRSPSTVILEPKKIKCVSFHYSRIYLPWSDWTECHDLSFLNAEF